MSEAREGNLMEDVIIKGDLSKLSPEERAHYYTEVCKSLGLNPLTKPFEYIVLNGKLTLYATRACTDQLRSLRKVSVIDLVSVERDGVMVSTVKVQDGEGRTDMATAAVTLGSLKGDNLCNAIMKCETKAKRRATLSICGLGLLDELEMETIPASSITTLPALPNTGSSNAFFPNKRTRAEISAHAEHKRAEMGDKQGRLGKIPEDLAQIETLRGLDKYKEEVLTPEFMRTLGEGQYAVQEMVTNREIELTPPDEGMTKADYVRSVHEAIDDAPDWKTLNGWWNSETEKKARREYGLERSEIQALTSRVFDRKKQIEAAEAKAKEETDVVAA